MRVGIITKNFEQLQYGPQNQYERQHVNSDEI